MSVRCRYKRTKEQRRVYKESRAFRSCRPAVTPATWRDYSAWARLDGWRFYQRFNVAPYEHRRFAQAVRRRYRRVGNTTMPTIRDWPTGPIRDGRPNLQNIPLSSTRRIASVQSWFNAWPVTGDNVVTLLNMTQWDGGRWSVGWNHALCAATVDGGLVCGGGQ